VLAMIVIAAVGAALGSLASTPSSPPATTLPPASSAPVIAPGQGSSAPGAPPNALALARSIDPALVDIDTLLSYEGVQGAGTGIVLRQNGEVLTNNHVIEGATSISVTDVGNHKTYDATVVGYDHTDDVAVLQLSGASHLRTASIGDSATVKPGDGVVAVGNAEGVGGTPSFAAGSVTATNQTITAQDPFNGSSEQLFGLIEANTAIVPGYSGGAMVNRAGRVIGMVTAGSEGSSIQGAGTTGYAIPIDAALAIAARIEADAPSATVHVGPTPFLGVLVSTPSTGGPGAQIVEVFPGGPAATAGLVSGEIITGLDAHTITTPGALTDALLEESPGTTVTVDFLDPSGTTHAVKVLLGSGPPQ